VIALFILGAGVLPRVNARGVVAINAVLSRCAVNLR
jgi:hypothetical protein